jgi:hypothetical protein
LVYVPENPEDNIEGVIYRYVLVAGEVTFRRLLSYLAQHSSERLRRDRVALVLGSMASRQRVEVLKVGAQWKIRQSNPKSRSF